MPAREYECEVESLIWLTPDIFSLRFIPERTFRYEPGQFISVILPKSDPSSHKGRTLRRIYSFSSPDREAGYELCVQKVSGGRGSSFLASLKPGDRFRIAAPFGDFSYETPPHRNACFLATGTGIGPFKAMVSSARFQKNAPAGAVLLFGGRQEEDILFPGVFEEHGVEVVPCLTRPTSGWPGFHGRITEYLAALPDAWPWQETDFYLCGNGRMIDEVRQHLITARNVSPRAIRQEAYFSAQHDAQAKVLSLPAIAPPQVRKRA